MAISPHFQISSVDTTHQFRLSGNAAQNWKANTTVQFLCNRQGGIHSAHRHICTIHVIKNVYFCVPLHLSSSDLHLIRNHRALQISGMSTLETYP